MLLVDHGLTNMLCCWQIMGLQTCVCAVAGDIKQKEPTSRAAGRPGHHFTTTITGPLLTHYVPVRYQSAYAAQPGTVQLEGCCTLLRPSSCCSIHTGTN